MQQRIQFTLGVTEIGKLLINALTCLGQRIDRGVQLHLAGVGDVIADPQTVRQKVAQSLINRGACISAASGRQLRRNFYRGVGPIQTRAAFANIGFELVGAFHQRAQGALAALPTPLPPAGVKRDCNGDGGQYKAGPEDRFTHKLPQIFGVSRMRPVWPMVDAR